MISFSERLAELRTLSQQTSGRNLTDLSKAWVRPPVLHFAGLRIALAIALLIAVLLDALITRIGWNFPELGITEKWQEFKKQRALSPSTNIPDSSNTSTQQKNTHLPHLW